MEPRKDFVGKDLWGNSYYEAPPQKYFFGMYSIEKPRRSIVPPGAENYDHKEMEVGKNLPYEWQTWLQMRRQDPPSFEEVERNLLRSKIVKEKARLLEEKAKEEKKPKPPIQPLKQKEPEQEVESWTPK